MSNQSTPHSQATELATNVFAEPSGPSLADLVWYLTPVLTCIVVALCLLILFQMKDGGPQVSGAGVDGPQPGASQQEEAQTSEEQPKEESPDTASSDIGKLTIAEFVAALEASNNSRQQIASLLESLGKPVEVGESNKEISERIRSVLGRIREMSEAEVALKQLESQVGEKEKEKESLKVQLEQAKQDSQRLAGEIRSLSDQLDKVLAANNVSAQTKTQLLQGRDTVKQLDDARKQMLANLEKIAKNQVEGAVNATSGEWTGRMNWITRMANVVPVSRQRLSIMIPLIDPQAYESVKAAVKPLENEFLTWEAKFNGLEIWCFVVQGDRPPELCRWPQEYDTGEARNLWAVSGNTGNLPPTQLEYPLTKPRLKDGQTEKYLFILPVDEVAGAADRLSEFPFPLEVSFDVVIVHDRNFADLRAKSDELRKQLYDVQSSAGTKMESLSLLPSKERQPSDFQAKLQHLVRRSALVMGAMEAVNNER